jgi:16S rRNA processing protein RimM
VLIHSYAAVPEDIGAYGPLSDAAGARSFEIVSARATAKGVVARLEGVGDRNAAEALKGVELYIDRDRPPAAEDGSTADLSVSTRSMPMARRSAKSRPCRTSAPATSSRSGWRAPAAPNSCPSPRPPSHPSI